MATRLTAIIVSVIVGATLIAGWIVGAQREDNNGPVDLLILNGVVYPADGSGRFAEAVAVRGNVILRVGTNKELKRLRRPGTLVVDAHGGTILPGFSDAHVHFLDGSLALDEADLRDASSMAALQQVMGEYAQSHTDRLWLRGRGWRDASVGGSVPTRQQLDTAVPDRPAFITSLDGRTGWANSRALSLAGITRKTRNPKGGIIVRDPKTGEATGVLKDAAQGLIEAVLPRATRDDLLTALRAGIAEAHRLGLTSIQNAGGSPEDVALYDELQRTGDLKLRVHSALSLHPGFSEAEADQFDRIRTEHATDPLFRVGSAIADGAARYPGDELSRLVAMMDKRGWQVMIEARDERAVRMALDAYEQAATSNPAPPEGRRHRLEHVDAIDADDVPRLGLLGVIASRQPLSVNTRSKSADDRKEIAQVLLGANGRIAFGSDWPAVSLDPRLQIIAALRRVTPTAGSSAANGEEAEHFPLTSAIDAYTSGAAYASFDEPRKGTIAKGMLADLVILSSNIFSTPSDNLLDSVVDTTIFDGKIVFTRETKTTN